MSTNYSDFRCQKNVFLIFPFQYIITTDKSISDNTFIMYNPQNDNKKVTNTDRVNLEP